MGLLDPPALPLSDAAKTSYGRTLNESAFRQPPVGLVWDFDEDPVSVVSTYDRQVVPAIADPLTTYMAHCVASGRVYYVDPQNGVQSNDGLSAVTPVQFLHTAQTKANLAGLPCVIKVRGGAGANIFSERNRNFSNGNTNVAATVDTVWMAYNGRVRSTTHDTGMVWAADVTYTNSYKTTRSVVSRVFDLSRRDQFGRYAEILKVGSNAICDKTPNTFYTDGTSLWVHRIDGAQPTDTNTITYLAVSNLWTAGTTQVSVYLCGELPGDGFDLEGGNQACWSAAFQGGYSGARKFIGAKDCTFRYNGNAAFSNSVSVSNLRGFYYFENCDFGASYCDGLNIHNAGGAVGMRGISINCTGEDNGRVDQISCNGLTGHEDIVHIDVGSRWDYCRGGNVHFINSSQLWMVGSSVDHSLGDRMDGGSFAPCEVRTNNTAKMWVHDCNVHSTGAGALAVLAQETSTIEILNGRSIHGLRSGNITEAL